MTYMLRKVYAIEKSDSRMWVPKGDGTSTSQPDCNFMSFDEWLEKNDLNGKVIGLENVIECGTDIEQRH